MLPWGTVKSRAALRMDTVRSAVSPAPSNAHCAGRAARGICAGTTGRSEAGGIALGRQLAKEGRTGGARTAIGGEEGQAWGKGMRARRSRIATEGLRGQGWAKRRLAGYVQGSGSGVVIVFRGVAVST